MPRDADDELRTLRGRVDDLGRRIALLDRDEPAEGAVLGRVYNAGAMPATGKWVAERWNGSTSTSFTTCTACLAVFPATVHAMDSIYGGPVAMVFVSGSGTTRQATANVSLSGYAACNVGSPASITVPLRYDLICTVVGGVQSWSLSVHYFWCCDQSGLTTGGACSATVTFGSIPVASVDCASPNMTFTHSAASGPFPNPYPSGGTITITS
jgi:hypothetical protein